MKIGYARVSTAKQAKDGNSLADQRDKLIAAGAETVVEEHYTGTKMDRPALTALLNKLEAGDELIVTKLDRFARTAADGGQIINELHQRGVVVNILNMGRADSTPMGNLMLTMLLAFAQFERDMIVERTQGGKAIARSNSKKVDGRPNKYTTAQMDHALSLLGECSYSEVERLTGISKSTLVRAARRRKVATK